MSQHAKPHAHQSAPACDHQHHGHEHHHDVDHDCCPFHEALSPDQVQRRFTLAIYGGVILLAGQMAAWFIPHTQGQLIQWVACAVMAWPLLSDAIAGLKRGQIGFPTLVALAFCACLSQGDLLSAGLVAFFMIMADQLENRSAIGARLAIEGLVQRTPDTVHKRNDGQTVEVSVDDIHVGDTIEVRPGEILSVDGQIAKGETSCDESSISGESLPVTKQVGDDIYAGTTNLSGAVVVTVTRRGEDTTVGKVKALILSASKAKTAFATLVERNAPWYTQCIVMLSGITWFLFRDEGDALTRAIAVLIMGCPCSLVIATPSVMIAAITAAARAGIMVKQPQELENLHRINHIFFDKTGTLTYGEMELVQIDVLGSLEKAELLAQAASMASHSNHPYSRSLQKSGERAGITEVDVDALKEIHGQGLKGTISNDQYWLGREEWVREELGLELEEGQHRLLLGSESLGLLGAFLFEDQLRPEAHESMKGLREVGVQHMSLVSGDRQEPVQSVSDELKLDYCHARCLPEDKLTKLQEAQQAGHRVAAVGDGINDAPLLAAGQVGIAMGAMGAPVAIESSSIALMSSDLSKLPFLFTLSAKTDLRIRINIGISLFILLVGLLLSSLGWLSPVLAAVLHNVSALFILFNSAQLIKNSPEASPPA